MSLAAAARVVVLDHHKTALESFPTGGELASNMEVTFDMRRSGAMIALDYFKPQVQPGHCFALLRAALRGWWHEVNYTVPT